MLYAIGERELVVSFAVDLVKTAATRRRGGLRRVGFPPQRCAGDAGTRKDGACPITRSIHTPSPPSYFRSTARSDPKSNAASSIRWDPPKARSTSATSRSANAVPDAETRKPRATPPRDFGVAYDWDRIGFRPRLQYANRRGRGTSALLKDYRGSHIMTFAGDNAGRGRVRDWVKAYGDPRDPNVGPVDWVERIPLLKPAMMSSASWRICWSIGSGPQTQPPAVQVRSTSRTARRPIRRRFRRSPYRLIAARHRRMLAPHARNLDAETGGLCMPQAALLTRLPPDMEAVIRHFVYLCQNRTNQKRATASSMPPWPCFRRMFRALVDRAGRRSGGAGRAARRSTTTSSPQGSAVSRRYRAVA